MKPGRALILVAVYGALIAGGIVLGHWLTGAVAFDVRPSNEAQLHALVMSATGAYIAASALPFVPGAEIGFALMVMLGTRIAPLVYLSMVLALGTSFFVGRLIPARVTAAAFEIFGLRRARELVLRIGPLDANERLKLLCERAPKRIVPFLLAHRYLMLALAFNLPGNTLLGGGGGIALAAGLSGIFKPSLFLLTVALAVAPVPLLFVLTGWRP